MTVIDHDVYLRQHALLDPAKAAATHVAVVGLGTVGSWAARCLAAAGFGELSLWDMDTIEAHNMPSQEFWRQDIGKPKLDVVARNVKGVNPDVRVNAYGEFEPGTPIDADYIISAVDNMELRKQIAELSAKLNPNVEGFMDFRMAGFNLQAWHVDNHDAEDWAKYEKTLYGSDQVVEATCGTRTFSTVGPMAGALAAQFITLDLSPDPDLVPPFYVMLDLGGMFMQTAGMKPAE